MAALPVIRAARPDDLPAILALYRDLHPAEPPLEDHVAQATWAAMLHDEHVTIFLAKQDGVPAATCMLVLTPNLTRGARPFGTIENVVTRADMRGRGLGKRVLAAACAQAWREGAYKVMLMTGSKRDSTLGFYAAAGFTRGKTAFEIRRP